jgi:catechol 2,3-dioxygenase
MSAFPEAQLAHVGIFVRDLDKMVEFYERVFGLAITDRGVSTRPGAPVMAFMSRDPREHHQVAFGTGRPDDGSPTTINQISFRVAGLEELRTWYARLVDLGIDKLDPRNHGNAWSIYFLDPEGNRLEIYTATDWYVSQPCGAPLDLTKSAATIREETATLASKDPNHCTMDEWSSKFAARLG